MSHSYHRRRYSICLLAVTLYLATAHASLTGFATSSAGDVEYFGKLDADLVPHTKDLEQVIFKPLNDFSKIKFATPLESGVKVTAGRLFHPPQDKSSILTLLVELD